MMSLPPATANFPKDVTWHTAIPVAVVTTQPSKAHEYKGPTEPGTKVSAKELHRGNNFNLTT